MGNKRRAQAIVIGRERNRHETIVVDVPEKMAHEISLLIAQRVRARAPLGPKHSRNLIRASWRKGQIGIHIPPQAIHLYMLDRGIKPFNMMALEGKTIPIRGPNGSISFRRAKDVGKRKITSRDEKGQIITSKIAWRHPGVKPMNFIEPAFQEALAAWTRAQTVTNLVSDLQQDSDLSEFLRYLVPGGTLTGTEVG